MNPKSNKTLGVVLITELVLFCAYSVIISLISTAFDEIATLFFSTALIVFVFAVPVFIYLKQSKITLFAIFKSSNERTRNSKFIALSFVFAFAITVTAVNLFSMLTDFVFSAFGLDAPSQEALGNTELILTFIRNVIFAAVLEEVLLRGVVLHGTKELPALKRILLSALLFALIHLNLRSFFYAFAAGFVIAFFTLRYSSLLFGIFLHLLQNLFAFVFTVLRQAIPPTIYQTVSEAAFWVLLVIAVMGIAFTLFDLKKHPFIAPTTEIHNIEPQKQGLFSTELVAFIILASVITAISF